jgi:hypothetical protein
MVFFFSMNSKTLRGIKKSRTIGGKLGFKDFRNHA